MWCVVLGLDGESGFLVEEFVVMFKEFWPKLEEENRQNLMEKMDKT
jgi:hypothetical protein